MSQPSLHFEDILSFRSQKGGFDGCFLEGWEHGQNLQDFGMRLIRREQDLQSRALPCRSISITVLSQHRPLGF